jgi:hypothetical protein
MKRKFLDVIESIVLGAVVLLISFAVGITIPYIVYILISSIHISWNINLEPIFRYVILFLISLVTIYGAYEIGSDLLWGYKRKRNNKDFGKDNE